MEDQELLDLNLPIGQKLVIYPRPILELYGATFACAKRSQLGPELWQSTSL
jgi:hypothetical protein